MLAIPYECFSNDAKIEHAYNRARQYFFNGFDFEWYANDEKQKTGLDTNTLRELWREARVSIGY